MAHNPNKFYDDLQLIRLTAAVLYDRGRSQEHNHSQLAKDLAPLYQRRDYMVEAAVKHDLPGVICAVRQLQADAKAHMEAAKFLQEKAEDSRNNAKILIKAIKEEMLRNHATEMMVGDFTVTLVKDEVTFR